MHRFFLVLACAPLALLGGCDNGEMRADGAPAEPAAASAPAEASRELAPAAEPEPAPSQAPAPEAEIETAAPQAPPATVPPADVVPEVVPPATTPEQTPEQTAEKIHQEFVASAEQRLVGLRALFEDVGRQIDEKGEQAPEAWRQLKTDLQAAIDLAQARFDSLRSAASDQWEIARGELTEALDGLEKRIEEANKTITEG